MVKLIVLNAAAGGAVFLVGALIHDFGDMKGLGDTLAFTGIGYAAVSLSLLVIPLYKSIRPQVHALLLQRAKSTAYDDLLRYKNLLDQKIISQEEFEAKSRELKAKLL